MSEDAAEFWGFWLSKLVEIAGPEEAKAIAFEVLDQMIGQPDSARLWLTALFKVASAHGIPVRRLVERIE